MRQHTQLGWFNKTLIIIGLFAVMISTGCKTYKLGYANELPFETIFVKPTINSSHAPQAQALLSSQLRQNILRDTRVKLVAKEKDADAVLLVDITEYNRSPGARSRLDTVVALNFDLSLVVNTSLYNQKNGDFFFKNRKVSQRTNAYANNPFAEDLSEQQGFLQAEYEAMPRLTRDLARKIADEVLRTW